MSIFSGIWIWHIPPKSISPTFHWPLYRVKKHPKCSFIYILIESSIAEMSSLWKKLVSSVRLWQLPTVHRYYDYQVGNSNGAPTGSPLNKFQEAQVMGSIYIYIYLFIYLFIYIYISLWVNYQNISLAELRPHHFSDPQIWGWFPLLLYNNE